MRVDLHEHHLDMLATVVSTAWAILAIDAGNGPLVPQLAALCSGTVAFAFAGASFTRWASGIRGRRRSIESGES